MTSAIKSNPNLFKYKSNPELFRCVNVLFQLVIPNEDIHYIDLKSGDRGIGFNKNANR